MVGEIEGTINAIRYSKELQGQNGTTYWIVNYFILGQWYSKTSPLESSLAEEGDLVFVHYKELERQGNIERRIESLELIEKFVKNQKLEFKATIDQALRSLEIAANLVGASLGGKEATLEALHDLMLEESERIMRYVSNQKS